MSQKISEVESKDEGLLTLRKPWREKLAQVLQTVEKEIYHDRQEEQSSTWNGGEIVKGCLLDVSKAVKEEKRRHAESIEHVWTELNEVKNINESVTKSYSGISNNVKEILERVSDLENSREAQHEAYLRHESQFRTRERWERNQETEMAILKGELQDLLENTRQIQLERSTAASRGANAATELVDQVREEMMQHVRTQAQNIAKIQSQTAFAVAVAEEIQSSSQFQAGGGNNLNQLEIKSYIQDALRSTHTRIEERFQSLERDMEWKLVQENRVLERKLHEYQNQLMLFISSQPTPRAPFTGTSVQSSSAQTHAHCPPPPPPLPPQQASTTIPASQSDVVGLEKLVKAQSERIEALEKLLNEKSQGLEKSLENKFAEHRASMSASLEKEASKRQELSQNQQTQLEELEKKFTKELEAMQEKNTDKFEEENDVPTKELWEELSNRMSTLEASVASFKDELCAMVKSESERINLSLDPIKDELKACANAVHQLRAQAEQGEQKLMSFKGTIGELHQQLSSVRAKMERENGDLVGRMTRLERTNACAQVEKKAQQELEEARIRALQKAGLKVNSAGSSPQSFTVPDSQRPASLDTGDNSSPARRYTIHGAPTSFTSSPVSNANKSGSTREKTPEQLEREAKRQEELAAVRARLAAFEAKWKQNQQGKAFNGRHQPPPPRTPPPPHLIAQQQNLSVPPPPAHPRCKTAPSAPQTEQEENDEETEALVSGTESENDSEESTFDEDDDTKQEDIEQEKDEDDEEKPQQDDHDELWNVPVTLQASSSIAAGRMAQKKPLASTIACSFCRRVLPGKNTAALHEKVCEKRPKEKAKTVTCDYCDENFSESDIDNHKQECDWLPSKCKHCDMIIILRDIARHEARCSKNPQKQRTANALQQLAAQSPQSHGKHFESWTSEEVIEWLRGIEGLGSACITPFANLKIDGAMLSEITEEDLSSELDIQDPVDRKQVWLALTELRNRHHQARQEASQMVQQILGQ